MDCKITFSDPETKAPRTVIITAEQASTLKQAMQNSKTNEFVFLPGYGEIKAIKVESMQMGTREKRKPKRLITYHIFENEKQYRIIDWRFTGTGWEEVPTDLYKILGTQIEQRLARWFLDESRTYETQEAIRLATQIFQKHGEYVCDLVGKELSKTKKFLANYDELDRFCSGFNSLEPIAFKESF